MLSLEVLIPERGMTLLEALELQWKQEQEERTSCWKYTDKQGCEDGKV